MSGRTIRIVGVLAVVLGVCLLTVPVALADSPWDYPSVIQAKATQTEAVRPDDLAGPRGPGSLAPAVRPDDLAVPRGPGAVAAGSSVTVADEGGFDWSDGTIVAAVVLGVLLLLGVAVWTDTGHRPTTGRHAPT